ncbi:hypothetical protein [Sediminibacillus massiliensis]|uniref:hypothetical protein n=1 Tax=Sediminibacillus massiliensis TaxID=1926277 RepID=UPI0009887319|nr:hypothetical protein [Sediminibacillus massiliensis]
MGYAFLFMIGFGMAVSGGVTLIIYLNFLPAGLSWFNYFLFIQGRVECYFLPAGLLIMMFALYKFPNYTC